MKIAKLMLLSAAVILFSCGDDDDPTPSIDALVGTWAITSLDYQGTSTTTMQGASIEAKFTGTGKDLDLTTTFNKNPNTVTNQGSYTIVLTTTVLGQTTTEEYTGDEVVTDGTWTLNGNKLTVTTPDGPQEATIVEQTATTMKLKIVLSETETDQGMTLTTHIEATYNLKKNN
jgi:hypothetical protein